MHLLVESLVKQLLEIFFLSLLGLFPDVGGGYVLPRMKGKLGIYLALTGENIVNYFTCNQLWCACLTYFLAVKKMLAEHAGRNLHFFQGMKYSSFNSYEI